MKKRFIGLTLVMVLCGIGTTYGYWNKTLKVSMSTSTGSFYMKYAEAEQAAVTVVNENNEVLDTLSDVNMEVSSDQREADIQFTQSIPLAQLMAGSYIRIRCPLVQSEGAIFPLIKEEPEFAEPLDEIHMDGEIKGVCINGNIYEYPGELDDYNLTFELFNQISMEDEELFGYVYLRLSDESKDMINSMSDIMLELDDEELQEAVADDCEYEDEGIVVEYSGELTIYFKQINEENLTDEDDLHRNEG